MTEEQDFFLSRNWQSLVTAPVLLQLIIQLTIAYIMYWIGSTYSDDCENGVTDYLVTGGWINFAINILPFIFAIFQKFQCCVLMDEKKWPIKTLRCIHRVLPLVSFVLTIWVHFDVL